MDIKESTSIIQYFHDARTLLVDIKIAMYKIMDIGFKYYHYFDCIVAMKRSGWMIGVYISNNLDIPVFTPSEIKSIPKDMKRILLVDDKVWSGKSLVKIENRIIKYIPEVNIITACLYKESGRDFFPDIYVREIPRKNCRMWYE